VLYLLGSATFTGFFDDRTGETLRLLGSGARFESINRGIIDLRDLLYYASLTVAFLALNVFALERQRWAKRAATPSQRNWRIAIALLLLNLLLANIWLAPFSALRVDITEGKLFSISQPTRNFLNELDEPLLIRGYFSSQTHALLAPLLPQLRDLLREYEVAGNGKVLVEFVDPADDPQLEEEANSRYGINATPFQIADRHQKSLVNAYFNVLVAYGSEHTSLGFADLIEVRAAPHAAAEVKLRNPEYDITHAIKKVLFDYRSGGNLFDGIREPVELIGYVSADDRLPQSVLAYKQAILQQLELAQQHSDGKFSFRFIEPEARGGAVAAQIAEQWGVKPMSASADNTDTFYFHLTLADSKQVVEVPTDDFNAASFRLLLDASLKRFAPGLTKIVALALPKSEPLPAQIKSAGATFENLERAVTRDYSMRLEDLSDGSVTPEADILAVVSPHKLDDKALFAIDQFLMRGGTVVLATSPFTVDASSSELRLKDQDSGLQQWLAHNGLKIERTLVLDSQNASFRAPVARESGDYEFRDVQLIDYPYFIDLRPPGLAPDHAVTENLPQVTMAWASPITLTQDHGRRVSVLLQSSSDAWLRSSKNVMPSIDDTGVGNLQPPAASDSPTRYGPLRAARNLAVVMQGRFTSFFPHDDQALNAADSDEDMTSAAAAAAQPRGILQRSPESARIVLFSSNDFMQDKVLGSLVAASGTQYLGPLDLFTNTLDWALQDEQLLEIRSRAHFNRTLPPMERRAQLLIEYFNYGLSLLWLLLLALTAWLLRTLRRRHYARSLAL
jgi:ABC-2 type transport system permease protein